MNEAWREMVSELRGKQQALIRAMVSEGTSPGEREQMATEYRLIESFVGWPDAYRMLLEGSEE